MGMKLELTVVAAVLHVVVSMIIIMYIESFIISYHRFIVVLFVICIVFIS